MATILIVEDDDDMRNLLQLALEYKGYKILTSPNGIDALYQAQHYKPDLIVLDLMMPWASGDAVLGFIRSTNELKHTPVIVVSAHPKAPSLAAQYEADDFLTKPLDIDALRRKVETLLAQNAPPPPPVSS